MKKVVVQAPAKLNLALAVTGLLPGGYHSVDMLMQAVSLWERIEVSKSNGYSLRLPGSPIPGGPKNTASKAAKTFFYETGLLAGADITIHKAIPTRAGLAGGSADAAGVLVALNALYKARLSTAQLCEMGAKVGADVPFCLLGGTARAEGMGEKLTALHPLPSCWFVIVMPPGGVSTKAAYARYDEMGSPLQPDIAAACAAVESGSIAALLPQMQNMMEHANQGPYTAQLRRSLQENGAAASMMSGSGAAVFGLFLQEAAAKNAAACIQGQGMQVFVAQPVNSGPQLIQLSE